MSKTTKSLKKPATFDYINITIMTLFCITIIFPFWDLLQLSVTPSDKINTLQIHLWPEVFTLDNYKFVLRNNKLVNAFFVSAARTVIGTVLHLLVISLAAYPLSKRDLPFRPGIVTFFLIPMFFGGGLIPTFLVLKSIGLYNNFLVYVLPGAFSMYNCVIIRNYFMSLDPGVEEAAYIDGASIPRILYLILIPLSKPVLATVALWTMVGQWNSWFDAMIFITDERLVPVQLILRRMLQNLDAMTGEMAAFEAKNPMTQMMMSTKAIQAAMTMLAIFPIMCVYPFLRKYFVKGIMLSSVKG